ncbi:MAG: hypothetical protein K2L86_14515, partial [Lachnospiraceae bacterium]|nr:hypothetical protein [Lachnospiraceae bacterium]
MDSKGKKIGILFVLCALLAVMAVVLFAGYNRLMGKETDKAVAGNADGMPKQIIEADGKVHGADLSGFMKDSAFFDAQTTDGAGQNTYDEVD